MGAARRLYLYAVSAVSLLVLSVGLYNLVALVLGELADALGASIIGSGTGAGREQISLAIALVVVGAPVFAIHWTLVGRGWRGTGAAAVDDRFSSIRAFHLGLVATVALGVGVYAGLQLISRGFEWVLGVHDATFGAPRLSDAVAMLVVVAPIWWYHQRRRSADLRHDHLSGPSAWLTRLHRYAWAFVGLMLLVTGSSQVLETTASVLIGRSGFGASDAWLGSLAGSLAAILVGAGVFWFHATDARRVIRDAAIIGEDDRTTALRAAYFGTVILIALTYVAVTVALSLSELGQWMLGVAEQDGVPAFLESVVGPLLVAIPFSIAGWLHWTVLRREAAGLSPVALASAERLELHLAAGVGGAFLAVGTAQLLGRLLEIAAGAATADDLFRSEMSWFLTLIVVGAALWIPAWAQVLRRRAATPMTERRATAGRAYLYLVVGASLIAAVPSAAFTLYRLIDTVLGGRGIALGSDLAIPIAVVIVTSVIATYHGRLLVSDLRFSAEMGPPEAVSVVANRPAVAMPAVALTTPIETAVTLTLRGPAGTDLESVVTSLRERLPAGVILEAGRAVTAQGVAAGSGGGGR